MADIAGRMLTTVLEGSIHILLIIFKEYQRPPGKVSVPQSCVQHYMHVVTASANGAATNYLHVECLAAAPVAQSSPTVGVMKELSAYFVLGRLTLALHESNVRTLPVCVLLYLLCVGIRA